MAEAQVSKLRQRDHALHRRSDRGEHLAMPKVKQQRRFGHEQELVEGERLRADPGHCGGEAIDAVGNFAGVRRSHSEPSARPRWGLYMQGDRGSSTGVVAAASRCLLKADCYAMLS